MSYSQYTRCRPWSSLFFETYIYWIKTKKTADAYLSSFSHSTRDTRIISKQGAFINSPWQDGGQKFSCGKCGGVRDKVRAVKWSIRAEWHATGSNSSHPRRTGRHYPRGNERTRPSTLLQPQTWLLILYSLCYCHACSALKYHRKVVR